MQANIYHYRPPQAVPAPPPTLTQSINQALRAAKTHGVLGLACTALAALACIPCLVVLRLVQGVVERVTFGVLTLIIETRS